MDIKSLLLSFNGRISRQPYWIATLIIIGISAVGNLIPLINIVAGVATTYFTVCIYNKRLHDLGRSGWLQLIAWGAAIGGMIAGVAMLIPAMMTAVSGGGDEEAFMSVLMSSGGAIGVVLLGMFVAMAFHIWLGVARGQTGANRFGPDPLNPVEVEAFN